VNATGLPPPPQTETHVIARAAPIRIIDLTHSVRCMGESRKLGQEQRATFRVAVKGRAHVDAYLVLAGKKLGAVVGDVSAEGIFVRLERGLLPSLKVEAKVDVEVSFEGDTFVMHGVIRSQHADGYGIYFPDRDRDGRANPLSRFGRISAHLQRSSLSQRLKILKLPE